MISKEKNGHTISRSLRVLDLILAEVTNPTTGVAVEPRGCENHIKGKSTRSQKFLAKAKPRWPASLSQSLDKKSYQGKRDKRGKKFSARYVRYIGFKTQSEILATLLVEEGRV